jgi:hypothetical protein
LLERPFVPTRIPPTEKVEAPKVGRVVTGPEITQLPSGLLEMTTRLDIYEEADRMDLVNGCDVDFVPVPPWKIIVQTSKWIAQVLLPHPHDKDTARLRIFRKGGRFEIISQFETSFKVDTIPVPLIKDSTAMSTVSWTLPRVVIDLLPTLDLSNSRQLEWIRANLKSMFTRDEIVVMNDRGTNSEKAVEMWAISRTYTLLSFFAALLSKGNLESIRKGLS